MERQTAQSRDLMEKIRFVMRRKSCEKDDLVHRRKLLDQQILGLKQDINALKYLEKNLSDEEIDIKDAYVEFLDKGGA